jgi:hypothetical protein
MLGREISVLDDGALPAGTHRPAWTASSTPAGAYLAVLSAGATSSTAALLLVP